MKLIKRRRGSTRTSKPVSFKFHPNYAGQFGLPDITLETEDQYLILVFETEDEVRELLSQAHIVNANWRPE
jgi:hypothetical protein